MSEKQLELFFSADENLPTKKQKGAQWKLFIDGAARNNPGPAGAGIYIVKDNEIFMQHGFFLGPKTNNQAEYLALLLGLLLLKPLVQSGDKVHIISDSQLLVRQLKGEYRIKNVELKPMHTAGLVLIQAMKAHIYHVLRIDNAHADSMANYGIDHRVIVPQDLKNELKQHGITL